MHKNAGRKKMHKGDEIRSVKPEDFQKFLDEGFVFGMPDSYREKKRKRSFRFMNGGSYGNSNCCR